jgi:exodeoxyribonuclease VII small subunit
MEAMGEDAPNGDAGERTYESAVARLETIIARLDSGEAELRETLALCTEAKELIVYCKDELAVVSDALTELKLDELVENLGESGQG